MCLGGNSFSFAWGAKPIGTKGMEEIMCKDAQKLCAKDAANLRMWICMTVRFSQKLKIASLYNNNTYVQFWHV